MTIKQSILEQLVKNNIISNISSKRIMPNLGSIYLDEQTWLDSAFISDNIPTVTYKSSLSSSGYSKIMSRLITCIQSTTDALDQLYTDNKRLVDQYNILYARVKDRMLYFRNTVNALLGYNCIYIDNGFKNQTINSYVGKIGKYITLPFFINSVQLYTGNISINEYSSGNIIFSNTSTITSLPLDPLPSIKISSNDTTITYKLDVALDDTIRPNAFYCKANQDVESISATFISNGSSVYIDNMDSNEALFTFNKIDCDTISITLKVKNVNIAKPVSIQVDEIIIFNDIQFSQYGSFESKSIDIGQAKALSEVSLTYNKSGYNTDKTNTMLAISGRSDIKNYSNINIGDKVDISYYKLKNAYGFKETELFEKTIKGTVFDTLLISKIDDKWNMDYKNALILYGLNTDYLNFNSIATDIRYNNWNKVGNYYVTYLLNYYDNIYINIGSLKCTINGKEYTGNIKLPIGILAIQVHSKDINFDFGNIFSKEDTANQYNFAYLFSGVPSYNKDGLFTQGDISSKEFDISSTGTIELGTPFIPLTESVVDSFGNTYVLSLSPASSKPGTYTIDSYNGRLSVNGINNVKYVTVNYISAQADRRPVGIMFNRLLTFTETNNAVLNGGDSLSFSFDGDSIDTRYLILPKITNPIKQSQVLYNLSQDEVFTSVKLDFSTDDKYKTPLLSDIYISVG